MFNLLKSSVFLLLLIKLAGCAASDGVSSDPLLSSEPDTAANPLPYMAAYLTTSDSLHLLDRVERDAQPFDPSLLANITIEREHPRQSIVGFGFALTGGSARHIHKMSKPARDALLQHLFGSEGDSIGMSFIRISVGASDLDEFAFSYNENADDLAHTTFTLGPHLDHLIPVLQDIVAVNPDITIIAAPWSAPRWMKSNNSYQGGTLLEEYYPAYVAYLLKYIDEMKQRGIPVDYLSVQNEPLHPGNNPSMMMSAKAQATFIKHHLGPAMANSAHQVKIIAYDHNPDRMDFPLSVLGDLEARRYIDGTAFHLYAGRIESLSKLQRAHPDKHLYFTEQWYNAEGDFGGDFRWHMQQVLIGAMRNWARGVIEWNLTSSPSLKPHTPGGCTSCLGAVSIDGDKVAYNAGYYVIAHASKFVPPGSVYLPSNVAGPLHSAAFLTPGGERVLIVFNESDSLQAFNIHEPGVSFSTYLEGGAALTLVWASR